MAHSRITTFHDDGTITAQDYAAPNYHTKRGKVPAAPKAAWGNERDGMGRPLDADAGRRLLDEALGD